MQYYSKHVIASAGDSREEKVVGADRCSALLSLGPNDALFDRGFFVKVGRLQGSQKRGGAFDVPRDSSAAPRAEVQFGAHYAADNGIFRLEGLKRRYDGGVSV